MEHTKNPAVVAALWMTGTLVSFMAMAVAGRELSSELNTFQILLFRTLVGMVIIAAYLQLRGWHLVRTNSLSTHILRNLAHFGGQYGWFYGLAFIPLAEVFAIEFTVPAWTAILAIFMLGEKLTRARLLAVALGLIGTLIILRPGIEVVHPAALAVLAGAFCFGITNIKTKKLAHVDHPVSILFYMLIVQFPLALVPSISGWANPSLQAWLWISVVGVTALTAHYCITMAMQQVDATVVAPMDFLRLPLITLVGFILYAESIDWIVLLGAGVMFIGNYINITAEKKEI